MGIIKIKSKSTSETENIGRIIGGCVGEGSVIALTGTLAAGKTALSRGVFESRGYADSFSSPSYTIINEYVNGENTAYHMDVYRLSDEDELDYTGYEDCINNGVLTVIEWADMIPSRIPATALHVDISLSNVPDERFMVIKSEDGELLKKLEEALNVYTCD